MRDKSAGFCFLQNGCVRKKAEKKSLPFLRFLIAFVRALCYDTLIKEKEKRSG